MGMRILIPFLALSFLVPGCTRETTLPEELTGTYTATDRKYADRWLEFSPIEVAFGLGEAGQSRHAIESVTCETDDGKTLYTVAYAGEGGTDRMAFYYSSDGGGSIVLRNQPLITWTRQGVAR